MNTVAWLCGSWEGLIRAEKWPHLRGQSGGGCYHFPLLHTGQLGDRKMELSRQSLTSFVWFLPCPWKGPLKTRVPEETALYGCSFGQLTNTMPLVRVQGQLASLILGRVQGQKASLVLKSASQWIRSWASSTSGCPIWVLTWPLRL